MNLKFYILLICLQAIFFISCTNTNTTEIKGELLPTKYSKNFEIYKSDEGYCLKIKNRFDESDKNVNYYYLSSDNKSGDIQIPIKKAICLSTTHCAFISQLAEVNSIKGISGIDYVYDSVILNKIKNNEIIEVGYDKQINYERIISLKPDVVFAFGVDNSSMSSYQKLTDIGIPVIFVGDFLEELPMGRTEWIKFFGCFYDKLDEAIFSFDSIDNRYDKLKNTDIGIYKKPKILVGLPWQGTWWVPGGNSFFANFIKDAGGDYVLGNNSETESIPYSIEEIFFKTDSVDVWLHPNSAKNKNEIIQIDERLKKFPPFRTSHIYNNNKRTGINGGNDFWESGIIHPDIILNDLQILFYPELDPDYKFVYYTELK